MNVVLFDENSLIGEQIVHSVKSLGDTNHRLALVRNPGLNTLSVFSPSVVLLVTDSPSGQFEQSVLDVCRLEAHRVLCVFGRASTILIGPLEVPGNPGCATCVQLRWENSVRRTSLNAIFQQQLGSSTDIQIPLTLPRGELSSLGTIVVTELLAIEGGSPINTAGNVGLYRVAGEVEWVPLVPSHECPRCNLRPEDGPQYGALHFDSHTVHDTESLRVNRVDYVSLTQQYVHQDIGYVSAVHTLRHDDAYVRASAVIHTPSLEPQVGYGSSFTEVQAEQAAILEVLERACVVESTSRRPNVYAAYSKLRDDALHPSRLGLHDDVTYRTMKGYQPFDEDKEYCWLWAYSTQRDKPILIPEQVAYYGRTRDKERFVKESSNGCALGSTLEEAVLHGIFEVLERDGLMNMWFGEMPVPELALGFDSPESIHRYISLIEKDGYQVRLFNMSHDLQIPAVFAVAVNTENRVPKVVSGSASHVNPYQATSAALRELMVQVLHLQGISEERIQQGRDMVENPCSIRDVLDHVVAAAMPEAYPRWNFLLDCDQGKPTTVTQAFRGVPSRFQVESRDIRVILESVLHHLHQNAFDVIVMNQTNAEAAYGGLYAVKVIIPGMTPVAFGHGFRRVDGLFRVYELPHRMGYRSHVLTKEELNPNCHPLS